MAQTHDYHFLILPAGLPAAWFVQAAREYCTKFHPIVTDDLNVLNRVPAGASIGITLLARSEEINFLEHQAAARREDAEVDAIVAEDLPTAEAMLNARAAANEPFPA
jgi:hypothetical protein